MTISTDGGKAFGEIQHLFMTTLTKVVVEGTYLNILKAIYNKLTANIVFFLITYNTNFWGGSLNMTYILNNPYYFLQFTFYVLIESTELLFILGNSL